MKIPSFKQYLVEEKKEVFFTFGRLNPPHIGHGNLMNILSTKAGKSPYLIYLSQSQDAKKNPLSYQQKIKYARKMFPKHSRNIIMDKNMKTVFDVADKLYEQGYNSITMVVGGDRIAEFKAMLNKYNGVKRSRGFYNFEKITLVSTGERDPDAEGLAGMSATKLRNAASENDFATFSQGLPKSMVDRDAKSLFKDLRLGMGIKESTQFRRHVELETVSETREQYVSGGLFQEGDRVITRQGKEGYVHRLGANHVIVALDEGRISRQWIDDVELMQTEDLRKWFGKGKKGDWVRVGTDGEIKGDCAREPDEGKPKCMPRSKAHSMSKKDRASAARRKRRADPDADRPGTGNKPIMVKTDKEKKEGYRLPDEGTDEAVANAVRKTPCATSVKKLKVLRKRVNEDVSQKQISDLEKFGDRLLNKFDIDIEFTRHFADRMNDRRNDPAIKVAELQKLFKKIARNKGEKIKSMKNAEAVLKDIQTDLNLPIVVNYKNGEFEVINKTIMRKKDFKTRNKTIKYESVLRMSNNK